MSQFMRTMIFGLISVMPLRAYADCADILNDLGSPNLDHSESKKLSQVLKNVRDRFAERSQEWEAMDESFAGLAPKQLIGLIESDQRLKEHFGSRLVSIMQLPEAEREGAFISLIDRSEKSLNYIPSPEDPTLSSTLIAALIASEKTGSSANTQTEELASFVIDKNTNTRRRSLSELVANRVYTVPLDVPLGNLKELRVVFSEQALKGLEAIENSGHPYDLIAAIKHGFSQNGRGIKPLANGTIPEGRAFEIKPRGHSSDRWVAALRDDGTFYVKDRRHKDEMQRFNE